MKKSTLIMTLALILSITLGIGGTMAYLSDTDEDVNVMTLGNVKIDQIEKERVEQTNSGKDELQDYTQGKPLYPVVGDFAWVESDNGRVYQEWPTGGSSALFDTVKLQNEHDKIVFVENTGKSDAYVRTIFAFEAGDLTAETINNKLMHWNRNSSHWTWTDFSEDMATTIDGVKYYLRVATYTGTGTVHPGGILPAGETTRPSLLQLFLDKTADNELCESFGDTYDILVVSQAVQTMGFENKGAVYALNTAFGDITAENNPWVKDGEQIDGTPAFPVLVATADELAAALTEGANVTLTADIDLEATKVTVPAGTKSTLNLGDYTITGTHSASGNQEMFLVKGELTVNGGEIVMTAENNQGWNAMAAIFDVTSGGVLNLNNVTANVSGTDMNFIVHLNNWGDATAVIENCDFTTTYCAVRAFNSGYDMNTVTIKNSKFSGGRMFWVHNYTSEGKDDSTLTLDIYNNGNTCDNEKPVRFGFSESTYYNLDGTVIE